MGIKECKNEEENCSGCCAETFEGNEKKLAQCEKACEGKRGVKECKKAADCNDCCTENFSGKKLNKCERKCEGGGKIAACLESENCGVCCGDTFAGKEKKLEKCNKACNA